MLPILLVNIGNARRTLPHDRKGASRLGLFILRPFHIIPGAFRMNVCRTVSQAFRIPIPVAVMSAIFRVIRVIVMVR